MYKYGSFKPNVIDIRLSEFLRYLACGAVLLLTISVTRATSQPIDVDSLGGSVVVGAVALVIGAIIYSVHRAVIFWLVLRRFRKEQTKAPPNTDPRWGSSKLDQEIGWDFELIDAREQKQPRASGLRERADQVHLLYTCAEAILLGVFLTLILPDGVSLLKLSRPMSPWLLIGIAGALACAAVVAHRRYIDFEVRVLWPQDYGHDSAIITGNYNRVQDRDSKRTP